MPDTSHSPHPNKAEAIGCNLAELEDENVELIKNMVMEGEDAEPEEEIEGFDVIVLQPSG